MVEIKARPDPISVSERAVGRISAIVAREQRPSLKLRLGVSGGGCSGFQYTFDLVEAIEPGDIVIEREGATVLVDDMSLMYLLGSELDFVEDLTGAYFKVHNPQATSSCGCGTSFAI
jgi:iron-sulfur cluster insertion protein